MGDLESAWANASARAFQRMTNELTGPRPKSMPKERRRPEAADYLLLDRELRDGMLRLGYAAEGIGKGLGKGIGKGLGKGHSKGQEKKTTKVKKGQEKKTTEVNNGPEDSAHEQGQAA